MSSNSPPISAVVHVFNNARHLEECLKSIRWCEEILVIDLGSCDESQDIALRFADRVIQQEWVPIPDPIRPWSYSQAKYDWILCIDPDEVYPSELESVIRDNVHNGPASAAAIALPIQYYFRGRPLTCCIWYPSMRTPAVQHRHRTVEAGEVHTAARFNGELIEIPWGTVPPIKHYWKDSWGEFLESHLRYIKLEGQARYRANKRFGILLMLSKGWSMLNRNLIEKNGWRGGIDGILLSIAMSTYEVAAEISLAFYQLKIKNNRND